MNSTNGHINLYESESDSSLMKGISLGTPDAMEILMDRYLPMVSRISYRIICDIPESESVIREVFMRIWRHSGEYDFRFSVPLWICRLICQQCHAHIRRQRFLNILTIHPPVFETSAPKPLSPEEDYITNEAWGIYCRATGYLTVRQRMIFVLCELEGMSAADVSSVISMRSDRIRHNLVIARDKIKEELAKYGKVI